MIIFNVLFRQLAATTSDLCTWVFTCTAAATVRIILLVRFAGEEEEIDLQVESKRGFLGDNKKNTGSVKFSSCSVWFYLHY